MTQAPESKRRPAHVTWLSVGVITVAAVSFSGMVAWFSLPDLPYAVPPVYLLIRSGLWGAWGLIAAIGAFLGKTWAPRLIRWGGLAVVIWYWVDRIFLARSDYARANWPVSAIVTVLAIAFVGWVLSRPVVRAYFQEKGK
ncbi:MAG: hypothetical protein ACE5M4_06210 [Anaerolineales bacterium]